MKYKNKTVPPGSKLCLLRQVCNFIPEFLVAKLARETGVADLVRTFSAWSHVVSLLYAQLTHSIGLNDVCDALGLNSGPLASIRGAPPPSRNNLSHANKVRSSELGEKLFCRFTITSAICRRSLSAGKPANALCASSSGAFTWWIRRRFR